MSSSQDNSIKPQLSSSYAPTVNTKSARSGTTPTGAPTSVFDAEKWSTLMKQTVRDATNTNKATAAAPMDNSSMDALAAEQIKAELDYKVALDQLLLVLEGEKTTTASYRDVSRRNISDTNSKHQLLAVYKNQMNTATDVKLKHPQSGGNVDSWVSQAIKQTGVGDDWEPALKWIISKESSGNPNAQNPNSTAYGLMQFLDDTWDNYGVTKTSDPVQQVIAGIEYIKQRYGTADNAKAFWQKHHWY
jgi:soluble lytic murein transglycosylase-like protein